MKFSQDGLAKHIIDHLGTVVVGADGDFYTELSLWAFNLRRALTCGSRGLNRRLPVIDTKKAGQ